ncbi:PEP-CTERM sorting domain-containing protein [Roseateles sp. P5_E11]
MIQTQMRRVPAALLAALALLSGPARAEFFNADTGLTTPDLTVDFESVALRASEVVSDQFVNLGLKFDSAFANADMNPAFVHFSGNRVSNFRSNVGASTDFAIHFVKPVSAAAFAMVTADNGVSTFDAYFHGGWVESAAAPSSLTGSTNIYGFRDIVFDELRIHTNTTDHALLIDNLQFINAPAPEPASAGLLMAGLGLLMGLKRRPRAEPR